MVGVGRIISLLIFLVLNFVLAIFLESKLASGYTFELVVIVIGIILSIALLLGVAIEARWTWPVATILFSVFLANAVFLYIGTAAFVAFTGLVLVNVLGLLTAVLSINEPEPYMVDAFPLETYEAASQAAVSYATRTSKKSTTKKKKKK